MTTNTELPLSMSMFSNKADFEAAQAVQAVPRQTSPVPKNNQHVFPQVFLHYARKKPELSRLSFFSGLTAEESASGWVTEELIAAAPQPPAKQVPTEVDWQAVGRIIEAHYASRGQCVPGTSNWGAAIWKAAYGIRPAATPGQKGGGL